MLTLESNVPATIGGGTDSTGKMIRRLLDVKLVISPGSVSPKPHPPSQSMQMKSEKGANMPASATVSTAWTQEVPVTARQSIIMRWYHI